jgi:protein SCO1/2
MLSARAQPAPPVAPPSAGDPNADPTVQPAGTRGLDIEQKVGEKLPLDLTFVDETGATVVLGDYFRGGDRPVILVMAYYECPLLCPLVLQGVADAARGLDGWTPGDEYEIVTVSIDPQETPEIAAQKKQGTMKRLAMPGAEDGWHFLTGVFQHVDALAVASGFGYRYLPAQDEYAHGAVIILVSPDGTISRYLPGVRYDPQQLKLGLLDAGQGKIGSLFDQLVLYCYQFDPDKGKYTPVAIRVMQLGGLGTLIGLSGLVAGLFYFERKKRKRRASMAG